MSDENNQAIGDGDQKKVGDESGKGGSQTVAYETYSKVMDELKTAQRSLKEIQENARVESEKKLKEQGDWKTLAESREAELAELKESLKSNEEAITDSIKLGAFQKHLGGKLKSDKYYSFVDTSKIAIDPTTKKVDERSVKLVVAEFIKEHSGLVEFKKPATLPRVNNTGEKIGIETADTSKMTPAEYSKYILDLHSKGLIKS